MIVLGVIGLLRGGTKLAPLSALSGLGFGWLIGAWGGGDIGRGNLTGVVLATVVPAAIFGVRFGLVTEPTPTRRRRIEQKSRAWIFLLPAMVLIAAGLVIPLIKTIYLSFRNANSSTYIGGANFRKIFNDPNSFNLDNWSGFLTSRLFYIAIGMVIVGIIAGIYAGRRTRQRYERTESSSGALYFGFFLMSIAVLSTIRGTIFNNIWWVIVVTTLSTGLGLAVAVLADRAKGENMAKSLIFLPLAISFVGAGIIWRFMYIARPTTDQQTGVLNALWVWLGEVSNDTFGTIVAVLRARHHGRCLRYADRQGASGSASGGMAGDRRRLPHRGPLVHLPVPRPGPRRLRQTDERRDQPAADPVPPGVAVQQHVADGDPDLDPGRLRHGHPVGGHQGRADRADRGGQDRRRQRESRSSGG